MKPWSKRELGEPPPFQDTFPHLNEFRPSQLCYDAYDAVRWRRHYKLSLPLLSFSKTITMVLGA